MSLASTKTFFLPAYVRAKRAVPPVNKGLLGVSFVRFFMLFCELDLEQPKNEITTVLINEVMRKKQSKEERYHTLFKTLPKYAYFGKKRPIITDNSNK